MYSLIGQLGNVCMPVMHPNQIGHLMFGGLLYDSYFDYSTIESRAGGVGGGGA